jgi:hypothetical protein
VSFLFIWADKPYWLIPLFVGLLILGSAAYAWRVSHRDIDRRDAPPTRFRDVQQGLSVTMDPRTMEEPSMRELFLQVVTMAAHRRELPPPAGLVDDNLKPIADSRPDAEARVAALNAETQARNNELVAAMGRQSATLTQGKALETVSSSDARSDPYQRTE